MNQCKYINLFAFLDSPVLLTQYRNLNILGFPVNVVEILAFLLPALLVIVVVMAFFAGYRKPFSPKEGAIQRIRNRMVWLIKPYRHGNVFQHECYKVFVQQKAIVILGVFLAVGWILSRPEIMYFDYKTNIYNGYMEQIQGEPAVDKTVYLQSERELWKEKIRVSEEKIAKYEAFLGGDVENGEEVFLDEQQYEQEIKKVQKHYEALEVVEELCEEADRLEGLQKKNVNVGFVNKTGYRMYIGTGGDVMAERNVLLGMIFLILTLAGVCCYETSQNAGMFLRSTRYGRNKLFQAKCLVSTLVVLLLEVGLVMSEYYYIKGTFGLGKQKLSVFSLEMYADFPWDISIENMLVFIWILRFVMLWCMAMLVLLISGKSKNVLTSMVFCFVVLIVPAVLVYIGFDAISVISVFRPLQVTYFWNTYGFDGIIWMLPMGILLGMGIGAWLWQRKRT